MIKKALILAAGKGKRMWPLTENRPKPLLPIVGKSIIEKQIIELKKAGVKEVNVLIGYKMNKISEKLGNGDSFGLKINYIVQEEQKGTGHAVNQMKDKISEPFYCLNGDVSTRDMREPRNCLDDKRVHGIGVEADCHLVLYHGNRGPSSSAASIRQRCHAVCRRLNGGRRSDGY